jgi:biofilm PGA synthesis N-glycosyltransferase PgaC
VVELPPNLQVARLVPPAFTGLVLACVCLMQFAVSLMIERRYEKDLTRSLFWIIWYPMAFWMLTWLTTLVSFPKVMLKRKQQRARWVSPDRGIKRN